MTIKLCTVLIRYSKILDASRDQAPSKSFLQTIGNKPPWVRQVMSNLNQIESNNISPLEKNSRLGNCRQMEGFLVTKTHVEIIAHFFKNKQHRALGSYIGSQHAPVRAHGL